MKVLERDGGSGSERKCDREAQVGEEKMHPASVKDGGSSRKPRDAGDP